MLVLFACVIFAFGGAALYALYAKMDPDFTSIRSMFSRWSSPYNVLWTFGACFLLLLGGHNRPFSAAGGALVVVGISTVLGHVLRLVRSVAGVFRHRDRDAPARPGRRPRLVWEESDFG